MQDQTPIRTRPDGSIDTGFYMQRGRVARAQQARHLAGTLPAPGALARLVQAVLRARFPARKTPRNFSKIPAPQPLSPRS